MDTLSAAVESRVFDVVRKSGYDAAQVDRFMRRVAEAALEIEEELTANHAKIQGLERQLGLTKNAEAAVGVAFMAAAETKDRLMEDAERRAHEIVERARRDADDLSQPRRDLELKRREVNELAAHTELVKAKADDEADQLLGAARKQADRIVAEARRDALAAIEESKKEADDWLKQAQAEHQRVALMLRGLKAAVREMLDDAAEKNEAVGLVLGEETVAAQPSVRLPT